MKSSVLALVLFGAGGALPSAAAQAQEAKPVIRTTTSEVVLDIAVRDKRGKPVKNLKPGEVEIYEDGVRQEVRSFEFVAGSGKKAQNAAATPSAAPTARALREVNIVAIVLHNLDPVSRRRGVEAVREFLANDLPPETYVGIFTLDDRLNALQAFTNDRMALLQAAQNGFTGRTVDFAKASESVLTANPSQMTIVTAVNMAARTATATARLTGGEVAATVTAGADVATGRGAEQVRASEVTDRRDFAHISGMRETDKIITMIDQLGPLPGRKTVLLFTTGLANTTDPDRFQDVISRAARAGMTIYGIDTAGLTETSNMQAGNLALGQVAGVSQGQSTPTTSLGVARERSRQNDSMQVAIRASDMQAGVRALAEGTGGFLVANTNEYRKPFQRIIEDVDAHYEAVYRPSIAKYDGRLRKIEVKVNRPDVQVDSRSGYFALPDIAGKPWNPSPHEATALAVLSVAPQSNSVPFLSAAFPFHNDGANAHTALAWEVPGSSLTATPDPERNTNLLHASLLAIVRDANGEIVDKYSVDAPYQIPDANLATVRSGSVTYTHAAVLPPGRYTVETVVLDRQGGRAGVSRTSFESPGVPVRLAMSDLMLVGRVEPVSGPVEPGDPLVFEGKRMSPLLGTTLGAAMKPAVYFVVFPAKNRSEKPRLEVEFLVGGKLAGKQSAELPAPDASGSIPMFVGAPMRAGDCELKITALQGNEKATRSLRYTVK